MISNQGELARNRSQMVRALDRLRIVLEAYAARSESPLPTLEIDPQTELARVCDTFRLSDFERDVLLLAAAPELDGSFPALFAEASNDATRVFPTLSLALAALPQPMWSAVLPNAPLREWRLIEVEGASLVSGILRADEAVVHALLGFTYFDARLRSVLVDLPEGDIAAALSPVQQQIVERLRLLWQRVPSAKGQLICGDRLLARAIAVRAAQAAGLRPLHLRVPSFPTASSELSEIVRLCERAVLLGRGLALFECGEAIDPQQDAIVSMLTDRFKLPALFLTSEKLDLGEGGAVAFDVQRPSRAEQMTHWQSYLPIADREPISRRLAAQFDLHFGTIEAAVASAPTQPTLDDLWEAVRGQARPRLDSLMERVDTGVAWRDLVLPADRRRLMRQVVNHVRYRDVVYGDWAFDRSGGSRGMTVLFVGSSGTGKSLAARVIANILQLDLYRVDLSAVFSKYIGETEKNLRRIFDAAESGGVVLLFDEADALFGKRSEVKDSHDRHANVEVSYLLQRLEKFNGVAILTSNMREAFDGAFMRRFAFVMEFPFPDAAMRKRIWKRSFPSSAPIEVLDFDLLAKLAVPGGNIRNIALNAAVYAASRGSRVGMRDVAASVRLEYAKLDRSLHDPDLTRWLEAIPRPAPLEVVV